MLYYLLPRILKGNANKLFTTARFAGIASARPVHNWPTAVNFLLRRYATHRVIKEAETDLRKLKQSAKEDEDTYFTRFEDAHLRSGSILDDHAKMNAYIDGLDESIRESVTQFLQDRTDATILDVVEKAKTEGELWRYRYGVLHSRMRPGTSKATRSTISPPARNTALLSSVNTASIGNESIEQEEPFSVMTAAISTSGDIVTDWEEDTLEVSAMHPGIAHNAPGWKTHGRGTTSRKFTMLVDVCARCYTRGTNRHLPHPVSECYTEIPRDAAQIVSNYAALSLWEQAKVQNNLLFRAIGILNDKTYSSKGNFFKRIAEAMDRCSDIPPNMDHGGIRTPTILARPSTPNNIQNGKN